MNNAYVFCTKIPTRWFQLHPRNWHQEKGTPPGEYGREPGHVQKLAAYKGLLYMLEKDDRIPNAQMYPLSEIGDHFRRFYLTSSFAYMLAALVMWHDKGEKVDEVHLWGCNLTTNAEYYEQKACLEYWIGMCEGRGIKVVLPPVTALMRGRLYASAIESNDLIAMSKDRVEHWRREYVRQRDWATWAAGAYQESVYWDAHTSDAETKKVLGRRGRAIKRMVEAKVGEMNGAVASLREAQHMLVSLGGFDTTATEVWPPQLPNQPIPIPKALLEEKDASSASTNGTRPVAPEERPVPAGAAVG